MKNSSAISLRPFCFIFPSLNMMTTCMLCVLVPHIIMLFVTSSYSSLFLIFCSIFASFCAETLDKILLRKKNIDIQISILQGVLIGMLLPASYPPATIFITIVFTLLVFKYAFGGIAGSWINPVAIVILVSYCVAPSFFPLVSLSAEQLQAQNTSLLLIQDGILPVHRFDSVVTDFLNNYVFSFLGTTIPEGYVSLLWDSGAAIPAFRFNLLTLFASLVMFSFRIIDCAVPLFFLLVYTVLVKLFCPLFAGGTIASGDIILSLFTGGTLFTSFFVLPWFGTIPLTVFGRVVYGCIAGVAAFFISGYGMSSAGSMFTVVFANIFSLFIQLHEQKKSRASLSVRNPESGTNKDGE